MLPAKHSACLAQFGPVLPGRLALVHPDSAAFPVEIAFIGTLTGKAPSRDDLVSTPVQPATTPCWWVGLPPDRSASEPDDKPKAAPTARWFFPAPSA